MDVSVRDGAATSSGMAESNEAKGKAMLMAGNLHCTGASSANRDVIKDPDLIYSGQKIRIPLDQCILAVQRISEPHLK